MNQDDLIKTLTGNLEKMFGPSPHKEHFAARVIDRRGVFPVTPKMINQVIDRFACKPLLEWR